MSVAPYPSVYRPRTASVGGSGVALAPTAQEESDPDQAILDLFANGEQGGFYDPSDFSTMFQDSAGTVPVTAAGQPVGRILDKSGNNNHLSQPTNALRPTLQTEGGLYYLDYGGAHHLFSASINLAAFSTMFVMVGVHRTESVRSALVEFGPGTAAAGSFILDHSPSAGTLNTYGMTCSGGSTAFSRKTSGTYTSPVTNLVTAMIDLSVAGAEAVVDIRVDGAEPANTATNSTSSTAGVLGNHALNVGMRNGSTLDLTGRIYTVVLRTAQTIGAELAAAEEYGMTKTGIV